MTGDVGKSAHFFPSTAPRLLGLGFRMSNVLVARMGKLASGLPHCLPPAHHCETNCSSSQCKLSCPGVLPASHSSFSYSLPNLLATPTLDLYYFSSGMRHNGQTVWFGQPRACSRSAGRPHTILEHKPCVKFTFIWVEPRPSK